MSILPIEDLPIEDTGGSGDGGGIINDPPIGTLPGLGSYMRRRYTCNVALTDRIKALDALHNTIMLAARMYLTQGPNGKIRFHNKKPVDFAFGVEAWAIGETDLNVDDVSPWVNDISKLIVIDPHTNKSETREPITAVYDATGHNAVTLTTNEAGDIDITGFAGADGDTPATATIEFVSIVAATTYEIELDGATIPVIPSTADSPLTVSSFYTGAFKGHPKLNRRFSFEWDGVSTITITARFGLLTVDALGVAHSAPVADPTNAPVLAETTGTIPIGVYRVAYTWKDEDGNQTLLSPYTEITLPSVDSAIAITAVTPPADCTVCWYVSTNGGANKIRFHSENDGDAWTLDGLPLLDDPLPPDLNRTGTEVMRVQMGFSDREEERAFTTRSNVIRASYEWSLADQKKRHNRVDLAYRESEQDWRRIELRFHDKPHQAKIHKVESKEYNGNAIDTGFQAYRIGAGLLAEHRDAFFRYKWSASREACLLEPGDVVAITDSGSGVYNLPVMIEKMEFSISNAGMPQATFTAVLFANTLYDDSIVERSIPVISEIEVDVEGNSDLIVASPGAFQTAGTKARIDWFNYEAEPGEFQTVGYAATITVA